MAGIVTGDLIIEGVVGIRRVLEFCMEECPGSHARASLRVVVRQTQGGGFGYEGEVHNQRVRVWVRGEEGPLYTGIIQKIDGKEENGIHEVRFELSSGTVLMDMEKKERSYQDVGMSYAEVIGEVCRRGGGEGVWPHFLEEVPLGVPRIQYQETDWEFIKRLASHVGLPLYADVEQVGARVCIGLPEGEEDGECEWSEYTCVIDNRYYELGGEESGYMREELCSYEVESEENRRLGERSWLKGQEMAICKKRCKTQRGRLLFQYRLARPEWAGQRRISNEKLAGASLLGRVLSREGERVKLKLEIDEGREEENAEKAYGFAWSPATGNVMYLMPEEGSRVSVYFKGREESSAVAVNCIREEGEGGERSYRERSLLTGQGKELKLNPCCMGLISAKHKVVIDDKEGISITGRGSLKAASRGKVRIEGKQIILTADKGRISCYHGKGKLMEEGRVSFVKDSELHILEEGKKMAFLGSERTRIAGYNHERFSVENRFRDAPEEESYDTAGLVVRVITGGLVVCGVTIVTGGIAAGVGASATVVMSATAITGGMTVAGLAVSDYVSGRISSYESYIKIALGGSLVGAMTGAASLVPVSGGFANAAIDFATGMTGEGVMQLALTGEIDGEQMFRAGMFGVLTGALARKLSPLEDGRRVGEGGSGTEQTLLSGEEWYRYFQDTYGADNVNWNVRSFDDMLAHPTSLRGYTVDEISQILGDGWTRSTYGSNGSGWKFIQDAHPDNMVFYHGGGGVHEGAYWGVKTGKIGTVKIVDTSTYIPLPGDKATIIYGKDW